MAHRRFGKTVFAVNDQEDKALRIGSPNFRPGLKNPQVAYVAPTYGQAKRVAWDYFKQYTHMLPGYKANEAELTIRIKRPDFNDTAKLMLLGADNPDSHRGIYLDDLILDEFAEMDPRAWYEVFRPALSDRQGSATFIGTPKGDNHLKEIYDRATELMLSKDPEWFSTILRASETGIVPESELRAAKAIMSSSAYLQEYECDFTASLTGAFYGNQMRQAQEQGRITKVEFDRHVPVSTYWDLGMNDTTVIWFMQKVGRNEWHAIDYVEENGLDIPEYGTILRGKAEKHGYDYSVHVLPHDAKAKVLGSGGRTRDQMLRDQKIGRVQVLERSSVQEGINQARVILNQVWFDQTRTKRGQDALKSYTKRWDERNKTYSNEPLHNWASNGADGFRTFAMCHRTEVDAAKLPRNSVSEYDIFGGKNNGIRHQRGRRAY